MTFAPSDLFTSVASDHGLWLPADKSLTLFKTNNLGGGNATVDGDDIGSSKTWESGAAASTNFFGETVQLARLRTSFVNSNNVIQIGQIAGVGNTSSALVATHGGSQIAPWTTTNITFWAAVKLSDISSDYGINVIATSGTLLNLGIIAYGGSNKFGFAGVKTGTTIIKVAGTTTLDTNWHVIICRMKWDTTKNVVSDTDFWVDGGQAQTKTILSGGPDDLWKSSLNPNRTLLGATTWVSSAGTFGTCNTL